jgi:hypothetical protein
VNEDEVWIEKTIIKLGSASVMNKFTNAIIRRALLIEDPPPQSESQKSEVTKESAGNWLSLVSIFKVRCL